MERQATITWSRAEKKWILRLWNIETKEWEFSKSWRPKDIDEETEIGWVADTILIEIAHLQDLGWNVRIIV